MTYPTTPRPTIDRAALALRILDEVSPPNFGYRDGLNDQLRLIEGLSEYLMLSAERVPGVPDHQDFNAYRDGLNALGSTITKAAKLAFVLADAMHEEAAARGAA